MQKACHKNNVNFLFLLYKPEKRGESGTSFHGLDLRLLLGLLNPFFNSQIQALQFRLKLLTVLDFLKEFHGVKTDIKTRWPYLIPTLSASEFIPIPASLSC